MRPITWSQELTTDHTSHHEWRPDTCAILARNFASGAVVCAHIRHDNEQLGDRAAEGERLDREGCVRLADGIYFGLDEDTYHADLALGSTDLKALFLNPVQWQFRRLTELRASIGLGDQEDAEESAAKRFGRAVHTMVLEGPDAFAERHCIEPEKPEGLLTTREEIAEWLAAKGVGSLSAETREKVVSGRSGELKKALAREPLVAAARELGCELLSDDWIKERERLIGDRDVVSARWWATLQLIGRMLDAPRESLGGKSQRETVLTGGHPEVSVFATDENGVRLKARFDYLRIKVSVDVKTYAAREGREIVDSFAGSVQQYAYDMQAAHYRDMRRRLPALALAGRVFQAEPGNPEGAPPAELLTFARKVAGQVEAGWTWLMVQTAGCPETDIAELPPGSLVLASAEHMVREAKEAFARYRDRFGADALWQTDRGLIRMEDLVFNSSITSRGARRWEQA